MATSNSATQPSAFNAKPYASKRIATIDILRALTMVLMIFVNDLWSLTNIPEWLEHVAPGVDGIGLADVVFPAFLFIVGLSLPYAIRARRNKGASDWELIKHILVRTIALLVMGVFLVNGETINEAATGISRHAWNTLSCLSFILIWNIHRKVTESKFYNLGRVFGVIILVVLAFIYRGGGDEELVRFAPQWWGILGLIGWAYLASSLVLVFSKDNFKFLFGAWIFFAVLSMISDAGNIPAFLTFIPDAILDGTLTGFTMGGVLTSWVFQHYRERGDDKTMTTIFLIASVVLVILSVVTRPYWGLMKLGATPAWLFLCSAFTLLAFVAVYWIADVWGKAEWFRPVKPAGTDTLLTYLIPYFAYAFVVFTGLSLPDFFLNGMVGLIKSLAFAFLCVGITFLLNKSFVRLKL